MPCDEPNAPIPETEGKVWKRVDGAWRPLFGSFAERGISVEWHDFQLDTHLNWGRSFHPGSLELCLNFSGNAMIHDGAVDRELGANQVAIYTARLHSPRAERLAGTWHRFLTVEVSPAFLRSQCANRLDTLKLPLRRFVEGSGDCPPFLEIQPLNTTLMALRSVFLDPPVPVAAREPWFLGKILEVLAHTVFHDNDPKELFCEKHHRQNRDRVERVRYLLERDLENPPSLDMLAQDVGCSTFHLSRIFAAETRMSIPKYLRTKRIERASDLLRTGKMNVTEAAFAVGYSSLSAFNKAFVEQLGCCPGLYPTVKIAGRSQEKR